MNGLQRPFSPEQLFTSVMYALLALTYFLVAGFAVEDATAAAWTSAANAVLLAVAIACWLYIEVADPSTEVRRAWRASGGGGRWI